MSAHGAGGAGTDGLCDDAVAKAKERVRVPTALPVAGHEEVRRKLVTWATFDNGLVRPHTYTAMPAVFHAAAVREPPHETAADRDACMEASVGVCGVPHTV